MAAFLKILLAAIILVGLSWMAIAIKMFIQKNGKFSKSCQSVDAKTGKPVSCSCDLGKSVNCQNNVQE